MHRVEPRVFLVGESHVSALGVGQYLHHIGATWDTDRAALSGPEALTEFFGRLCYRSWEPGLNPNVTKVRSGNDMYLKHIVEARHGSVFEHAVSHWVFADISRVVTHELVRHRAGVAISQESLRYVRLADLGLWLPPEVEHNNDLVQLFERTFADLEELQVTLAALLDLDRVPFNEKKQGTSAIRRVAPIGLATTIGVTLNFRALRHIGQLRTELAAEAEIRLLFDQVMQIATNRWPHMFQDFSRTDAGEWQTEHRKI